VGACEGEGGERRAGIAVQGELRVPARGNPAASRDPIANVVVSGALCGPRAGDEPRATAGAAAHPDHRTDWASDDPGGPRGRAEARPRGARHLRRGNCDRAACVMLGSTRSSRVKFAPIVRPAALAFVTFLSLGHRPVPQAPSPQSDALTAAKIAGPW